MFQEKFSFYLSRENLLHSKFENIKQKRIRKFITLVFLTIFKFLKLKDNKINAWMLIFLKNLKFIEMKDF